SMRLTPLCVTKIPSPAERFVEAHDHEQLVALSLSKRVLRRKEQLFRFQDFEVAGASAIISEQRQLDRFLQRADLLFQGLPLLDQGGFCYERVGHFAKRYEHGLLVLRDCSFPKC